MGAILAKHLPLTTCQCFYRDVAQPGSALAWGARGRQFKSGRPDHDFSVECRVEKPGSSWFVLREWQVRDERSVAHYSPLVTPHRVCRGVA